MRPMSLYESGDSTGEVSIGRLFDSDEMKTPSFMMILTATGNVAYRRDDGIMIVPIGCLKN
jgi:uncharacterized protein